MSSGCAQVVVHQPADDVDGGGLRSALRRRQVDVLEHEVAQLVHVGQDLVVHAYLAARQGAFDDRVDHAADPR